MTEPDDVIVLDEPVYDTPVAFLIPAQRTAPRSERLVPERTRRVTVRLIVITAVAYLRALLKSRGWR